MRLCHDHCHDSPRKAGLRYRGALAPIISVAENLLGKPARVNEYLQYFVLRSLTIVPNLPRSAIFHASDTHSPNHLSTSSLSQETSIELSAAPTPKTISNLSQCSSNQLSQSRFSPALLLPSSTSPLTPQRSVPLFEVRFCPPTAF